MKIHMAVFFCSKLGPPSSNYDLAVASRLYDDGGGSGSGGGDDDDYTYHMT